MGNEENQTLRPPKKPSASGIVRHSRPTRDEKGPPRLPRIVRLRRGPTTQLAQDYLIIDIHVDPRLHR